MDRLSDSGQAGAEIEVTHAMLEAGVKVFACALSAGGQYHAVAEIYRAMELAKPPETQDCSRAFPC